MQLSENTLNILKNFANINSSIVLRRGKVQQTMSQESTILVSAILEDEFPLDFGIYDLNQFLGNITTLKNPDLIFDNNKATMNDGDTQFSFYACDPSLICTPPRDKELVLDSPDVSFQLNSSTFTKLTKLSLMNNLTHLTVCGKDGDLYIKMHEKLNDTSNFSMTKVASYTGKNFEASFKTENLKILPDNYQVDIKLAGFSRFINTTGNLTYFIALESN